MLKRKSLQQQSGQGLIEILIVAVIIIISSVALMQFQAMVSYRDSLALQRSDATMYGLAQLETLRDYQVLNTQSPYAAYSAIVSGTSNVVGVNATYTLTWTVTSNVTYTSDTIDMVVSWTDVRNNAQSIDLTTIVSGLQPVFSATVLY